MSAQAKRQAFYHEAECLYREMVENDWTVGVVQVADGPRVVFERKPGTRFMRVTSGRRELQEFLAA